MPAGRWVPGLGDRRRAREFIAGRAAAWTRWLAPGNGYGAFVHVARVPQDLAALNRVQF